jgi:selenocysteine-specific elongation factor
MVGFEPTRSEEERQVLTRLLTRFEEAGMSPPGAESLQTLAGPGVVGRMLQALVDDGLVIQTGPELRFAASVLEQVRRRVVGMVEAGQDVTVASLRDGFGTSRRYALTVLEYFDTVRITRRVGDRRVLGPNAGVRLAPEPIPGS